MAKKLLSQFYLQGVSETLLTLFHTYEPPCIVLLGISHQTTEHHNHNDNHLFHVLTVSVLHSSNNIRYTVYPKCTKEARL